MNYSHSSGHQQKLLDRKIARNISDVRLDQYLLIGDIHLQWMKREAREYKLVRVCRAR